MKTRFTILSLVLLVAAILAACSPKSAPVDVMADQSEMADEELMASEDDAMMEEPADDSVMATDDAMMSEDDAMKESESDAMMEEEMATTTFVIRIENVSAEGSLTVLAPGAYELNDHPVAFYTTGEADRGQGLEALAEDGDPSVLVDTINHMMTGDMMGGFVADVFNTPVGADAPGVVGAGAAYEYLIEAYPGQYLTFATMFVQSNDWFFAPGPEGLALFDADGNPISGDITDQIFLWNAGTEVDQTPGEGSDQAPRQAGPNTGEAENGLVSLVEGFTDYQILVTIIPQK